MYTRRMRALILPCLLIMAASGAHAGEAGAPGVDARLAEAEAAAGELTGLAAAVARAFESPLLPPNAQRVPAKVNNTYETSRDSMAADQVRRFVADCARSFRIEAVLDDKEFPFHQELAIRHQACRAVATRSMGPCAALAPVDKALGYKPQSNRERCTVAELCFPQTKCRRLAGQTAVMNALIRGGGADVCAFAAAGFDDTAPQRRDATCRVTFAPGTPAQVCAQENAAAGGDGTAQDLAECRARQGLKGAASDRACADKTLSPEAAAACRFAFVLAGDPRCEASGAALADSYCRKLGEARKADILADLDKGPARVAGDPTKNSKAAAAGSGNPRIVALSAFDKRNGEVEVLLARAAAALKAAGQDEAGPRATRLKRARAVHAQALSAVRAAVESR